MRKVLFGLLLLLAAVSVHGDVVTLPAAASIVGGSPFYSDVRVFNSSYASSLNVTATYRCFIGSPCPAAAPQIHFTLAPRQSRAFNDICADGFASPNTAGGVEFEFSGSSNQLAVTSRLYSTQPHDSVGMFIPGLESSRAASTTVLTSVQHDPSASPPSGFRTNAGVFNPGAGSVDVSFTITDDAGSPAGSPVTRTVAGHSGVQISGIFEAAGLGSLSTDNAAIVVSSSGPVFSYAAVLDNATTDPIFVSGAPDQTGVLAPKSQVVHVGRGGTYFVDDQSGTAITTVHVGDTVTWVWEGTTGHGTDAGTCSGGGGGGGGYIHSGGYGGGDCVGSGMWGSTTHVAPYSYSFKFTQAGSFHYFCDVHLGSMTGRVDVLSSP